MLTLALLSLPCVATAQPALDFATFRAAEIAGAGLIVRAEIQAPG